MKRKHKRAVLLLADDSPSDQLMVQRSLEDSRIDCDLMIVENGKQVLQYLRREAPYQDITHPMPDLILMDINMPIMNGITAVKSIRADEALHNMPIIMLTTSDATEDIEDSYAAGANAYITKPVDGDGFIDILKRLDFFWFQLVIFPEFKRS